MRMFGVAVVLAGALLGSVAHAQSPNSVQACAEQGKQQKLRGAPLADFLTKCANTHTAMPMGDLSSRCRAEAQRHTLSGEDLNAFMKRCEAGQVMLPPTAAGGPPTCDERARVRALSGEALTSFMRRCQAGQI